MSRFACEHCWGDIADSDERCPHCGHPSTLPRTAESGDDTSETEGGESGRSMMTLVAIIVALVVGSLLYRLLVVGHLEQTSALFIGLPAALAIAVACVPRTHSATGMIMKVMTIALLMSGVLLGEGFICILMASPIFYFVGFIVGLVIDHNRRREAEGAGGRSYQLLLLPLLVVASLEGVHSRLSFSRGEVVSVERTINADSNGVRRALENEPRFDKTLPTYLRLGFPKPASASGHGLNPGDRRLVHFAGGEGPPGDLLLEVAEARPGTVRFRVLSDTSHVSHWLDWKDAEVTWSQRDAAHTDVRWTLRYERRLDPAWYFGPWERYGARLAAGYLIDTLATPRE